jgi:hypothetical protein
VKHWSLFGIRDAQTEQPRHPSCTHDSTSCLVSGRTPATHVRVPRSKKTMPAVRPLDTVTTPATTTPDSPPAVTPTHTPTPPPITARPTVPVTTTTTTTPKTPAKTPTTTTTTTTTTSTTPATPPPAQGNVSFTGDFETGNISQWNYGAQCANTGVSSSSSLVSGTVNVESQIVGQGNYAAEFDLPAASVNNFCQALVKRPFSIGSDDYYGLMVRFPTNWQEPSSAGWGMSLAQFNFQNIWGSPVNLMAHGDHVSLVMQTGLCSAVSTSTPGCAYSNGIGGNLAQAYAAPAPLALGVWHEFVVHVHWAADNSGAVEVWHRLKGTSAWTKTVSISGHPTVQWTSSSGYSDSSGWTVDMAGAYRGNSDFPLTIWQDGFVRATSFDNAAGALP